MLNNLLGVKFVIRHHLNLINFRRCTKNLIVGKKKKIVTVISRLPLVRSPQYWMTKLYQIGRFLLWLSYLRRTRRYSLLCPLRYIEDRCCKTLVEFISRRSWEFYLLLFLKVLYWVLVRPLLNLVVFHEIHRLIQLCLNMSKINFSVKLLITGIYYNI